MAEALAVTLRDDPDVKELVALLQDPEYRSQHMTFSAILDYADDIRYQYDTILSELDSLKEKVSKITDKKNPLAIMVDNLETLASDVGAELKNLKDGIISFTKNVLDTVKEKGLSALGSVFGALHVKDGLQAMSSGLAKSVAALDKAVTRVDNLEQHNREKTAVIENGETLQPAEEQAVSLSELLADTRLDFENLSQEELKVVYEKLLAIGMDNDLTANENDCLSSLVEEVGDILPDHGEYEHQAELESEQGMGM